MSVYRRYFEIRDEVTLSEIVRLLEKRSQYLVDIKGIAEEIGAKDAYYYESIRGQKCAGFSFDKEPDRSVFKKVEGRIFYPKKSTKAGKALAKRIEEIEPPGHVSSALEVVGIRQGGFGVLMDGLTAYFAQICGSGKAGWFAVIPWKDVDPEELSQYAKDRDEGSRKDQEFDHLLWNPPAEWVEVKEWQVDKAINGAAGGE